VLEAACGSARVLRDAPGRAAYHRRSNGHRHQLTTDATRKAILTGVQARYQEVEGHRDADVSAWSRFLRLFAKVSTDRSCFGLHSGDGTCQCVTVCDSVCDAVMVCDHV
jgi:hypothetical protein